MNLFVELDLSGNKFDGEVSTEIGELTRLEKLYLDDNEFEGQIPSELGELDELSKFNYISFTYLVPFIRIGTYIFS